MIPVGKLVRALALSALATQAFGAQDGLMAATSEIPERWLRAMDALDAQAIWDLAAPGFQKQVTVAQFREQLERDRAPLGKVVKRAACHSHHVTGLPMRPQGSYIIYECLTNYSNRKEVFDTLYLARQPDGNYGLIGFTIN